MYNKQQKQAYLDYVNNEYKSENINKLVRSCLNQFSSVEKDYEIDIADADYETVQMMLVEGTSGGMANLITNRTLLKGYVDWTIKTEKTKNENNYLEMVNISSLNLTLPYKSNYTKDYEDLLSYMEIGLSPDQHETIDIVNKLAILMLYVGVPKKEIFDLKKEDYDDNHKIITSNGVKYDISKYDYLVNLLRMDSELDSYSLSAPRIGTYRRKTFTEYLLSRNTAKRNNDVLLSYIRDAFVSANAIYMTATQQRKKLSTQRIYVSGIYNRLYKNELITGQIDYESLYKTSISNPISEVSKKTALYNYQMWKKAWFS